MAGGSSTISNEQPALGSLQVQTSSYGLATALIWGRTKVPGNLLWYGDFTAIKHVEETSSGGKGGGGGVTQQNITYTYQAAVMVSICAGPINGITRAWKGKAVLDGATSPLSYRIVTYTERFTVPSGGVVTVAHSGTFSRNVAVRDQGNDDAGGSAGVLIESVDYTRSGGTYTFGAAFIGAVVDVQYQSLESGFSTPSALPQLGVNLATGTLGQPTWSYLTGRHPADAFGYSGLAYVYADKYDLSSGAQLDNHVFEVSTPSEFGGGIVDANMAVVVQEFLTDGQRGSLWPAAKLGDLTNYSNYCISHGLFMSPALQEQQPAADILQHWLDITNSDCVYSGLKLKIVPLGDESKTAHGATYTANTTPAYDLTVDDLIVEDGSLPVTITPRLNEDAFNHVRIEYLNRDNGYNVDIAAAKDQAHIEQFGERLGDPIQCHEITTPEVAAFAAQMELQRQMSLWNTYSFRLPWTKGRLEPAVDLVTLTVPDQYLFRVPVRITKMVENGLDAFDCEAEDCPFGHASAPLYGQQAGSGYQPQYNVPPPSVVDAVFFEAPAALAAGGTGLEIWGAVASPGGNWGGANVWVSLDGVSYRQVARQVGASRIGTLTSSIASGLLQLHDVTGQLVGASAEDAAALATLSIVLGSQPEYLAYEGATLLGEGAYTLGGLVRGAYGSPATSHAAGDRFVRVDGSIVRSGGLDALYIGKTIYFKFTSFNVYGSAEQGLAEVDAMPYVVTGAFAQASPGTAGRGLVLKASAQAIKEAITGVRSPAAVTLTAELRGTLQGTPTWSVISGAATLSGSGMQRTVDTSTITSPAQIQVQLVDEIGTYVDQVTLTVVSDGATGAAGNKYAQAVLYQWATVQPTAPNGTSTWTWATAVQSSYTGGNGWQIGIPANPGNAGLKLWSATQQISAPGGTVSTTVSWAAGAALAAVGQNGAGVQTAEVAVYAWAVNIASLPALTGTATYTWASGGLSSVPSGWSATPGSTATAGQTLYKASLRLQDASTSPTTAINYTSFSTSAVGYAGLPGSAGTAGASYRIAYAKVSGSTIGSGTVTTAGASSFPPVNSWGRSETWGGTVPSFAANESVMQTNGVYDPTTGNTVWGSPYLASWRVGKLSAITADIGDVTAGSLNIGAGRFQVSSSGYLVAYGAQLLDESGNVIFSTKTGATAALPSNWVSPDAGWLNSNVSLPVGTLNANAACDNPLAWNLTAGITGATTVAVGSVGTRFWHTTTLGQSGETVETIPLNPSRTYSLTANFGAAPGNNRVTHLVVRMFKADGTELTNADTGWGGTFFAGYAYVGIITSDNAWHRYGRDFGAGTTSPIPSSVAYCKVMFRLNDGSSGSGSVEQSVQDVRLVDVTDARAAAAYAATAQAAADAAQHDADVANDLIDDMSSDGKLTPSEKPSLRLRWDGEVSAKGGINTQAAALGITTENTAFNSAIVALGTYLNNGTAWAFSTTVPPLWISDAQLGTTTTVVGATMRSTWKAYTDAKQALMNKISAVAATQATWALVGGAGKPADNATVGATIGTNLGGSFNQSTFDVVMAGQTLIRSLHIQDLRTTNYAEDGSGNPTAGAKLASGGTALKVANQSLQIGTAIFTDYWARLVQGIDGANGTALIWRGNNDASTRGGAPNINCLSIITRADEIRNANFQETWLDYRLTPSSYTAYSDNLDAMTQIHVQFFATATAGAAFTETYQPCASRTYDGASGIVGGVVNWGWRYGGTGAVTTTDYETNNAYDAYIRVRIANSYGWSATKDLYGGGGSAAVGRTMTATTITGSAGSSGGGGGAVGGGCPAPWVKVQLQSGQEIEAGALYNGARVAAVDDQTLEPIAAGGVIADLRTIWKTRYRIRLTSGDAFEFSEGHRLAVLDRGWVPIEKIRPGDHILGLAEAIVESCIAVSLGQAVSFLVRGAGTYFAGGLLSHNTKLLP